MKSPHFDGISSLQSQLVVKCARWLFLIGGVAGGATACDKTLVADDSPQGGGGALSATAAATPSTRRLVLVYRGPGSIETKNPKEPNDDGTSTELAKNLIKNAASTGKLEVRLVGPGGFTTLLASENRKNIALVAFPGGPSEGAMQKALTESGEFDLIKSYVSSGGRYLGICAGAYLAGSFVTNDADATPQEAIQGFDFLPRSMEKGALLVNTQSVLAHEMGYSDVEAKARMMDIAWSGLDVTKSVFFQNGPAFYVDESSVRVFGRYLEATRHKNGVIFHADNTSPAAALVTPYFDGKVGVIGVHLEADKSWLEEEKMDIPSDYHPEFALGTELINDLMKE